MIFVPEIGVALPEVGDGDGATSDVCSLTLIGDLFKPPIAKETRSSDAARLCSLTLDEENRELDPRMSCTELFRG